MASGLYKSGCRSGERPPTPAAANNGAFQSAPRALLHRASFLLLNERTGTVAIGFARDENPDGVFALRALCAAVLQRIHGGAHREISRVCDVAAVVARAKRPPACIGKVKTPPGFWLEKLPTPARNGRRALRAAARVGIGRGA